MTLSRRRALAVVAALAWPRGARAETTTGVLERIARARASIRTLRGPFVQTRTIGLLATDVRSRGTLTLVRPDRLRWELAPPDEVTFWVGPEGLAYRGAHGGGRMPAANARAAADLDDLRTMLGDDLGKLRARWDLRIVRDDPAGAELEATPRPGVAARLRSIGLSLGPDLARPKRVVLVEGPRDRTLVEFGELAVNVPIDEATMRPPP